jgi:hypothetical protein
LRSSAKNPQNQTQVPTLAQIGQLRSRLTDNKPQQDLKTDSYRKRPVFSGPILKMNPALSSRRIFPVKVVLFEQSVGNQRIQLSFRIENVSGPALKVSRARRTPRRSVGG